MERDLIRFVVCRNEECNQPMLLPDSSLLEISLHPPLSHSDDYYEIFACPQCGHVFDYKVPFVHLRPCQPQDQDYLKRLISELLNFDCAEKTCGIRVIIQRPNRAGRSAKEIVAESKTWVLREVHCKNGHLSSEIPSHRWAGVRPSDGEK
jgi:hypothetical protein